MPRRDVTGLPRRARSLAVRVQQRTSDDAAADERREL